MIGNKSMLGKHHSEETKRKISKAHKGMKISEKTRKKLSKGHKGKHHSEETKKIMSEAHKGKYKGEKNPAWKGGKTKTGCGYIYIYIPNHPNANLQHYIFEHRLVMEKCLGRYLKKNEIVHHIDGNKSNNIITNLRLETRNTHKQNYSYAYQEGYKMGMAHAIFILKLEKYL